MPAIHVKRGVEFKPDLFAKRDRTEWLDAVGEQIKAKGITVKVGEGATALEVKDGATLKAAYAQLQQAAQAQGRDVQRYIADLVQALDDVIKPTSIMSAGDVVDLTKGSELSKVLGMDDPSTLYASTRTEFGKKPDNTLSPLGVRLSRAAPTPGTNPPVPPTPPVTPTPVVLDRSLIDNPDGTPKINYIEKTSFGAGSTQVGREGIEAEAVREVQGIDGKTLHSIVSEGNTLRRLQRPTASLAFTLGSVPLDEMKWDSDSHAMREKNPFMSISIEAGRGIRRDPASGEWQVQVSRDYFFDHLQAAVDVTTGKPTRLLRDHGIAIRGRERIEGEDGNASRVLIQSKLNATFDPVFGVKTALKRDIRTDSPRADTVPNLDKSVQTGKPIGFYNSQGADAISAPYDLLASKGVLPDVGPHEDVLAMQTVGYKRQPRGRYHLNETPTDEIRDFFKQSGEVKIKSLADTFAASTTLSAGDKSEIKALSDALLDRSAIVKEATAALQALDPSLTTVDKALIDKLWPDTPLPTDKREVKMRRVVAEAIKKTYDVFAEKVDELAPKAAGTVDASGNRLRSVRDAPNTGNLRDYMRTKIACQKFMDFAARQANWGVDATKPQTYMDAIPKMKQAIADEASKPANQRTITNALESAGIYHELFDEDVTLKLFEKKLPIDNALASVETAGPLLKAFDALMGGADKAAFIEDFAAYLAADGSNRLSNATDKDAMLADTRKTLVADDLEITHRMVESAGTMAKTLGFDAMRKAYASVERSGWGNFIIDSTDFCEFYDKTEGEKIQGAAKGSRNPLDFSKMKDFKMSNDFQIELAYADPYLEAIDKATKSLLIPLVMEHAAGVAGGATAKEWLEKNLPNEHLVLPDDKAKIDARAAFVKGVADAIKAKTPELTVDENLLVSLIRDSKGKSIDSFTGQTAGLDATQLATRTDDLNGAKEVWTTMLQAQETIADARGERVMQIINDVARQKGLTINATWGVPAKSKDDHGIDLVVT